MFLPTTTDEVRERGWKGLDVVMVSGDTYVDSPYNGTAMAGHWLVDHGYRVGIVCQPDVSSDKDITRLGRPELFWSVSAGCVDSMVANYTASNRRRKDDDFTPGGNNDRRPDRACIAYTNLIKRYCKGDKVVLSGIEASLRRIAHYDAWTDSVRRSVLVDSKADAIAYGMTELANLELAGRIASGSDWSDVRGICRMSRDKPEGYLEIPSYEECRDDKEAFRKAFLGFYRNNDPLTAKGICQRHGDRYLVQNPPQRDLTRSELDSVYESDYMNAVHPFYLKDGAVKAMDTISNSVTTHRGCYGECAFCAIALHQGRRVISRSEESILREVERMASAPGFNGVIRDVGGPTANMYMVECPKKARQGACPDRRCLYPSVCPSLHIDHGPQIDLLKKISKIDGVRKVFVGSGVRYDMVVADRNNGQNYLDLLARRHVSGQMKIAPEHVSDEVLRRMGKPGTDVLERFIDMFGKSVAKCGKDEYLTYYFMAAHPGCRPKDMVELDKYCTQILRFHPQQVQIFTPTPSTLATMMYHVGKDEYNKPVFVERSPRKRQDQKDVVVKEVRNAKR